MILTIRQEAKTGIIDLEGDEPAIIEKFINFLYTQQYDDGRGVDENLSKKGSGHKKNKANTVASTSHTLIASAEALHTNTALYIVGEKYEYVSGLTLS